MKNLERVAAMLVPATTTRPGEPFADLEEVYARLFSLFDVTPGADLCWPDYAVTRRR